MILLDSTVYSTFVTSRAPRSQSSGVLSLKGDSLSVHVCVYVCLGSLATHLSGCKNFLMTCDLYFVEFPEMTQHQKISLLVQQLTGRVLDWAAVVWRDGSSKFQDYLQFNSDFPDQGKSSSTCLLQLCQGKRSAAEYSINFSILTVDSGWNKPALISAYRQGLNAELQTELACRNEEAPVFRAGDRVWLSTWDFRLQMPFKKLSLGFMGPYKINSVTYKLQLPSHMHVSPVFHVSHLRPATPCLLDKGMVSPVTPGAIDIRGPQLSECIVCWTPGGGRPSSRPG